MPAMDMEDRISLPEAATDPEGLVFYRFAAPQSF